MTGLPAWDALSLNEKAAVVFFLRTVEGEGHEYAAENYPMVVALDSVLCDADSHLVRDRYYADYDQLGDEFMELYDLGEKLRHVPAGGAK